jgi:hypothetical protein
MSNCKEPRSEAVQRHIGLIIMAARSEGATWKDLQSVYERSRATLNRYVTLAKEWRKRQNKSE